MVNVAVLGCGVVGSGVVEVIKKNSFSISQRAGMEIKVKWILDIRDLPDSPYADLLTKNSEDIFNDDTVSIIVETIGGVRAAYEFTKKALQSGRHVVTSNKELVAKHGPELLKMASDNKVNYLFEASVGGGIPIIRPLNQCLAANEIHGITGILNGTTNYILTQMKKEGKDFADALKEAQKNGYAEADPTADIEGHDACRKIAILSSIAYNEYVNCENIYTEGISKLTVTDMLYAEKMNSTIKLIGISKRVGNKVYARVSPAMIRKDHPLANVEDVFNAIVVKGDAIGEAMFYGRGAGKLPTASAVVADIIDIVKHTGMYGNNIWERKSYDNLINSGENDIGFFVRVKVRNSEEAKKFISRSLGQVEFISLNKPGLQDELAFVTAKEKEGPMLEKIKVLGTIASIKEVVSIIRIEEE
ncbi:MAG: homoserine dehydrogenase [Bacillota bacterium]|nr:homoserine dehydrogenase [Bacillota bacterium]